MNHTKNRAGFSLLELLIVVAIMGLLSVAFLPLITNLQSGHGRTQFVSKLNQLVQFGWQQAVVTHKVHRILFDIKNRKATLEVESNKSTTAKPVFEPLKQGYLATSITWPDTIVIKQFFIEGFDEMKRFGKTETTWFYLIPDGLVQAVTINFVDKEQIIDNKPKPIGLVLNPFTAQFKVYNAFA